MSRKVARDIFSVDHQLALGKNAVILGSAGVLALDAELYEADGQVMADLGPDKGDEANKLALTHGHGDHAFGSRPLAGGAVFAHWNTPEVIRVQIPVLAATGMFPAAFGYR